jgi:hypothetical protein
VVLRADIRLEEGGQGGRLHRSIHRSWFAQNVPERKSFKINSLLKLSWSAGRQVLPLSKSDRDGLARGETLVAYADE